jgi:hypothetical protein
MNKFVTLFHSSNGEMELGSIIEERENNLRVQLFSKKGSLLL